MRLKPYGHPDRKSVNATGRWSEGHVPSRRSRYAVPGKSAPLPRAGAVERRRIGTQMAAEAVVAVDAPAVKGRTLETTGANRSTGVEKQKAA